MLRRFWPSLLFLIPLLEILVLIRLGGVIGFWSTIWLLLLAGFAGAMLLSKARITMWERLAASVALGNPPTKELARGVLYLVAGVLLIFPGVLTDIAALLLFLPPVKKLLSKLPAHIATPGFSAGGRRIVDLGFGSYPPKGPTTPPTQETSSQSKDDVEDAKFTEYKLDDD